jgi:hypothetical protein
MNGTDRSENGNYGGSISGRGKGKDTEGVKSIKVACEIYI